MSHEWRRHVLKSADLVLSFPAGQRYWPTEMHEPLTIAFFLPYLQHSPWELKGSRILVEVGRKMPGMLQDGEGAERDLLRQLCKSTGELGSLPVHDVFQVL